MVLKFYKITLLSLIVKYFSAKYTSFIMFILIKYLMNEQLPSLSISSLLFCLMKLLRWRSVKNPHVKPQLPKSRLGLFTVASYQTLIDDSYFLKIWGGAIQDSRANVAYQQPIKSFHLYSFISIFRILRD